MSEDTEIQDLNTALEQVSSLLSGLRAEDLARPTPCTDWAVADLAGHLVVSVGGLAAMASGRQPDWSTPPDLTDGHAAAFERAATQLHEAWIAGPEGGSTAMACAELAVHTWDLATALGRPIAGLAAGPADAGLVFMQANLTDERRGDAFGPEQSAPEGAGPYTRIAAYAGRQV